MTSLLRTIHLKPKSQGHSSTWMSLSTTLRLKFLRRMGSFERSMIKFLFVFLTVWLIFWFIRTTDRPQTAPPLLVQVNSKTWKNLQDEGKRKAFSEQETPNHKHANTPEHFNEKPKKKTSGEESFNYQKLNNPEQFAMRPDKVSKNSRKKTMHKLQKSIQKKTPPTNRSKQEKNEDKWSIEELLHLLKHPTNVKVPPFMPRDASVSAIKNGVVEPLDDNEPVILIWWPPDYLRNKKENFLEREFQGICGKCRLTTDRSTFHRSNTIVLDNIPSKDNMEDLPPADSRRPEQAYIMWHRETPAKIFRLKNSMMGFYDTMFNYTMSYRRDADIVTYAGNTEFAQHSMPTVNHKNPQQFIDKVMNSKRHTAVWVVSNCDKTKGAVERMNYAKQLVDAGLKVDFFGKCFNRPAPRKDFTEFLLPYRFYLAFENSWHCKDYLTEKFWRNGLMSNVVPVLWGPSREDVVSVAPPNSYIHSEDFESPQALVDYLHYLEENEAVYRSYFNWRLESFPLVYPAQMLRNGYEPGFCKMCRVLNENNGRLPYKTLSSSVEWVFIDGNDSKCLLFDLEENT